MPGLQQLLGGTGLGGIYTTNKRDLMSVKKAKPVPTFVSLRDFCRSIGIYHTLATHLIELGVLVSDGLLGGKPTFRHVNHLPILPSRRATRFRFARACKRSRSVTCALFNFPERRSGLWGLLLLLQLFTRTIIAIPILHFLA
jgi:hypothetical protein